VIKLFATADAALAAALRWLIILLMATMTVVVFSQVLFRYAFNIPLSWSEELARFAFVWLCLLGTAYLVRGHQHLRVAAIESIVSSKVRVVLRVLQYAGALLCTGVFLRGGIGIVRNEWSQLSPATQVPMGYVYSVIPITAALMLLWIVANAIVEIRSAFVPPAIDPD